MTLHRVLRMSTALCFLPAAHAAAQPSASDQAAQEALLLTPVGALPQLVHVPMGDARDRRFTLDARYGRYRFQEGTIAFHNFGFGALMQVFSRIAVGATVAERTCDGCEGLRMASLELYADVWSRPATEAAGSGTYLGLLISGATGRPNRSSFDVRSLSASMPMAVTIAQANRAVLTVFFSPVIGRGSIKDDVGTVLAAPGTDGGVLFLARAGLGYTFAEGLAVHASVHRVVIEDSPMQIGGGFSWSFGGTRPRSGG